MPADKYTRDKLNTLKKIAAAYGLDMHRISDLRAYESWQQKNAEHINWTGRWFIMRQYIRCILNPGYTAKAISEHEENIDIYNRPCKCAICYDKCAPVGMKTRVVNPSRVRIVAIDSPVKEAGIVRRFLKIFKH
jgi:hypothetical protein